MQKLNINYVINIQSNKKNTVLALAVSPFNRQNLHVEAILICKRGERAYILLCGSILRHARILAEISTMISKTWYREDITIRRTLFLEQIDVDKSYSDVSNKANGHFYKIERKKYFAPSSSERFHCV